MKFGEAIQSCFTQYANFNGRASRSEFWFFHLFQLLVLMAVSILARGGIISGIAVLALLVPGLAVAVRRLHDTARSGWWYLISLVPLIGGIILLVWFCSRGTTGENAYGEDPLGGVDAAVFS